MGLEENRALVRRLFEAINANDEAGLGEIMAADVVTGTAFPGGRSGLDGFKAVFEEVLAAFPDYSLTIEDQIAERDEVVTRYTARGTHQGEFMGVAATGKSVELTGIDIDRVDGGVIVEHWSEASIAALLLELGFAPPQ
jgi:predicted ester cyclase